VAIAAGALGDSIGWCAGPSVAAVSLPIGIAYTQLAGLPSVRTADKRGDGRTLRTGEELRRDRTEQEVLVVYPTAADNYFVPKTE